MKVRLRTFRDDDTGDVTAQEIRLHDGETTHGFPLPTGDLSEQAVKFQFHALLDFVLESLRKKQP